MARSLKLVQVLKKQLRAQGITYKQLATLLELSESSIKHMFANNSISLSRLDLICEQLGIELSDLALIAEDDVLKLEQLPLEHEKELVNDMRLLLVTYCVMNYWTIKDITKQYSLSETECIQYLSKLDKMKMIELHTNNRIRLLVSQNFEWRNNGPIERFFRQQVQSQFFNSDFSATGEIRLVKNGNISLASRKQLVDRLMALGDYFEELNHQERAVDINEKHGSTMVLAVRQWGFQAFTSLQRDRMKS